MPQTLLAVYPSDATPINDIISFCRRNGNTCYFHGTLPVFAHAEIDLGEATLGRRSTTVARARSLCAVVK